MPDIDFMQVFNAACEIEPEPFWNVSLTVRVPCVGPYQGTREQAICEAKWTIRNLLCSVDDFEFVEASAEEDEND